MKVKVNFVCVCVTRDELESRETRYVVSSALELFGRMMSLRHLTRLRSVQVTTAKPPKQWHTVGARVVPKGMDAAWDYYRNARVRFDPAGLTDPEYVETLAHDLWQVMATLPARYDRTGNEQPAQLRKAKETSSETK